MEKEEERRRIQSFNALSCLINKSCQLPKQRNRTKTFFYQKLVNYEIDLFILFIEKLPCDKKQE